MRSRIIRTVKTFNWKQWLVLAGSAMPSTQTAPSAFAMPDFGWRLSDEDVADLLSFIRSNWGNHAAAVSSDEVGRVRKNIIIQQTAQKPRN